MTVKNKITIKLDKVRELKFDLNALEMVEDLTGKTLEEATQNLSMKTLKVLLYAGLIHEDKELTLEQIGSLITMENLKDVSKKLGECFKNLK